MACQRELRQCSDPLSQKPCALCCPPVPPWPCTMNAEEHQLRLTIRRRSGFSAPPQCHRTVARTHARVTGSPTANHQARSQSAGSSHISLLLVATRLDARRDLGQHAAGCGVVARVGYSAHRAVNQRLEPQELRNDKHARRQRPSAGSLPAGFRRCKHRRESAHNACSTTTACLRGIRTKRHAHSAKCGRRT